MDVSNDTTKRCSKGDECVHPQGPLLPATSKFFYHDKNKPDLMRSECKACCARMLGVKWKQPIEVPAGFKRCSMGDKCLTFGGPILPSTSEYFSSGKYKGKTNLLAKCKACRYRAMEEWARKAGYESVQEYNRLHSQKEEVKKRSKERRKENPGWKREKRNKREAKKRELPATFTAYDWKFALNYFNGACAYCGKGPSLFDTHWTLHQEHHIPLARGGGYTPQNIVPACQSCNIDKSDKEPFDWLVVRFGKHKAMKIRECLQVFFAAARQDNPVPYVKQSAEEKREAGKQRQREIAHAKATARRAATANPTHKACGHGDKCLHPDGSYLPIEAFHRNKREIDGYAWECKMCASNRHRVQTKTAH